MVVILENIQGIKEKCVYELPDEGIVQITGDNSNGKSILIKSIAAIAQLKIVDNEERRALINDDSKVGMIALTYKGKTLVVKLHEDRNSCIVQLVRNDGSKIARAFRDGGLQEIVEEFGFRVYNKSALCLQVFETFGVMPFVNTTPDVGYEIVDAVTTDTVAQQFLQNYKTVTHKTTKDMISKYSKELDGLYRTKSVVTLFDYVKYEQMYGRLSALYNVVKNLKYIMLEKIIVLPDVKCVDTRAPELEKIMVLPDIKCIDIQMPRLSRVPIVYPIPNICELDNLAQEIEDIMEILEGKCPTCGQYLVADFCRKDGADVS